MCLKLRRVPVASTTHQECIKTRNEILIYGSGWGRRLPPRPGVNDFCHWQKKRRRSDASQIFPQLIFLLEYLLGAKKIDMAAAAAGADQIIDSGHK